MLRPVIIFWQPNKFPPISFLEAIDHIDIGLLGYFRRHLESWWPWSRNAESVVKSVKVLYLPLEHGGEVRLYQDCKYFVTKFFFFLWDAVGNLQHLGFDLVFFHNSGEESSK